MKFTKSRDGESRLSVQIVFRVEREWLVAVVADRIAQGDPEPGPEKPPSMREVQAWMRHRLREHGAGFPPDWQAWLMDGADAVQIEKQATEYVDRLFGKVE
jgi:hypothetical protein